MLTRPNTARPLRIVIDPSALAHNLSRLRHARGGRPATGLGRGQGRCLRPWPGPSAGGAGRGGRPGRARCRRGLARDRPGLARPHPGSGRIVRPARSRPSPRHVARPGGRRHGPAGLACLGPPARPPAIWLRWSGDLGHAGFDASDYPDAYRRAQALAARGRASAVGHLLHYANAEEADKRYLCDRAFDLAIGGLPGPVSRSNSAALLTAGRGAPTEDWIRPGLALYGASPLPQADGARSACGR